MGSTRLTDWGSCSYHPIRGEADRSDPLATLAPRQLTPRARNECGRAGLLDSRVPQSDAAVLAGACDQPRRGAVRDGVYVLLMSGQSCRLMPVQIWYITCIFFLLLTIT